MCPASRAIGDVLLLAPAFQAGLGALEPVYSSASLGPDRTSTVRVTNTAPTRRLDELDRQKSQQMFHAHLRPLFVRPAVIESGTKCSIELMLSEDGRVKSAAITQPSPSRRFNANLVAAMRCASLFPAYLRTVDFPIRATFTPESLE